MEIIAFFQVLIFIFCSDNIDIKFDITENIHKEDDIYVSTMHGKVYDYGD